MVENKDIGQSKSNKIVFIYRIVVSIIMLVSIILVYILNHLGQSKEVDAMFNSTQNNLLEGIIGNTYDNTIATEHVTSEESMKKLSDWRLMLVNYENEMPKDYVPPLSNIDEARQFDSRVADSLVQMMLDMNDAGINHIWAQSTYRNPEKQKHLIEESIQEYLEQGKSMEEAEALTARSIGEPYKSEHNLGLAVDFNDVDYAFILRYPADKENITKIKYEPWHWRYVGPEYAKEMNDLGFCLEEYIEYLKNN